MDRKNAIALYLLGTLGQIWIVCIITFILRNHGIGVDFTTPIGIIAIGIGGTSSALWGIIIAVKYKKYRLKYILKDFFGIWQKYYNYLFVFIFLSLDFCCVLFGGKLQINIWYIPTLLFLKAILFGGIEEIGWRYTFQPILEERFSYIISTIITFFAWGVWHFSYFYIEGTLSQVQVIDFTAGLLVNSFILSALYAKTSSLWICVMTHSLINVFSQLATGGNQYVLIICRIVIIVIAVIFSNQERRRVKRIS
ncbi:MAG: CPBP family intramembrane metalloprotease [Oscillospiraceae bacterium]|nr:CPBP family intramembrane metalloprotease [Oscillospiraceae bacterium]